MAVLTIILDALQFVMLPLLSLPGWWPWLRSESVADRLHHATANSVRPILEISGVAGMPVGVLHRGEVVFRENLGLRNANSNLAPNSATIYNIGSLTKAFFAVAITKLLDDHPGISLETPVDHILPDYKPQDHQLRGQVSLGDFMSHRSVSRLETVAPIRRKWIYNNWGYGIVGAAIEKLSRRSYASYLEDEVLKPPGLKHTTSQPSFGEDENLADAPISLCNGQPLPIKRSYFFKNTVFKPAGGIFTNVDDMLQWAKTLLDSANGSYSSDGPLRQMSTIISNQIPLDQPSHEFRFYGMGWIRTQLPGVVGLQGDNPDSLPLDKLPVLGAGAPPMMSYYHQDSAPGYYSALLLFPETQSAAVVLTNSMPLNDAADWISQIYAAALFNFPKPADYVALKVAAFKRVKLTFDEIRQNHPGDQPRVPLASYTGSYINDAGNFIIDVREIPDTSSSGRNTSLVLRYHGREDQTYELRHLYGDAFEWSMTCDESARQARFPILDPKYFEVHFQFESDKGTGKATSLTWAGMTDILPQGTRMRHSSLGS